MICAFPTLLKLKTITLTDIIYSVGFVVFISSEQKLVFFFSRYQTEHGCIAQKQTPPTKQLNEQRFHQPTMESEVVAAVLLFILGVLVFNSQYDLESAGRTSGPGLRKIVPAEEIFRSNSDFVVDLTDYNFGTFLEDHPSAFVQFYAPWCGHCRKLAPTWDDLAKELQEPGFPDVRVGRVDCFDHVETCRKAEIRSFPTLRWYEGGKAITPDYTSGRSLEALVAFAKEKLTPNPDHQDWEESIDDAIHDGIHDAISDAISDGAKVVQEVAFRFSNVESDISENQSIGLQQQQQEETTLDSSSSDYPYHTEEDRWTEQDKPEETETIFGSTLVTDLTDYDFDTFLEEHPLSFVDFYAPWCIWCQRLTPTWDNLALKVKASELPLGVGRVDCFDHVDTCRKAEIRSFPTLRWYEGGKAIVPDYKSDRSLEALFDFAKKQVVKMKVANHERTMGEGLEDVYKSSLVTDLTTDNYHTWLNENEFAFVNFYAPWCQWSQRLAPTWASFADKASALGVRVGKVDCMAHHTLCRDIRAFPTLRWYKGGKDIIPDYKSDRSLEALMEFAKKQVANGERTTEEGLEDVYKSSLVADLTTYNYDTWLQDTDNIEYVDDDDFEFGTINPTSDNTEFVDDDAFFSGTINPTRGEVDEDEWEENETYEELPSFDSDNSNTDEEDVQDTFRSLVSVALTDYKSFQSFTRDNPVVFVQYCAPSIPACQELAPIWESFVVEAKKMDMPVGFGTVDCTKTPGRCKTCGALPCFLWYDTVEHLASNSDSLPRSVEALMAYAKEELFLNPKYKDWESGIAGKTEEEDDYGEGEPSMSIVQSEIIEEESTGSSEDRTISPTDIFEDDEVLVQDDAVDEDEPDGWFIYDDDNTFDLADESEDGAITTISGNTDLFFVQHLTSDNFDAFLAENELAFIDMCIWCQRLAPTWEKFALEAQVRQVPVGVGKIDCMEQADLCHSHTAFPTLRWYEGGNMVDFSTIAPSSLSESLKGIKGKVISPDQTAKAMVSFAELKVFERKVLSNPKSQGRESGIVGEEKQQQQPLTISVPSKITEIS